MAEFARPKITVVLLAPKSSAHFGNRLDSHLIRLGVKVLRSKNSDFVVLSVLDSLTLFYDFFLRRVRVYYPRLLLLSPPFFLLFCEFALGCTSFARTRSYSFMVLTPAKRIMDFAGVPPNNAAPAGPMSFPNGTPPAPDMGSAPPPGSGPDSPKTTLWMGELEPWMDENFIKGVFMSAAHETVNVKVIRDKNSGNAGYCFVEFQSPEAATNALGMNGKPVPNSQRSFKLNWASGGGLVDRRDDRGPEYSIFVGDLGPEVNEYVLVSLFQARFPSCKSAKIMTDAMSGQSRGYGFVRFSDENDQQRALVEMQGNRGNHGFGGQGHHNGGPMMGGMPQQQMWNGGGMQGFGYGGFNPATQMNQFTDPNNTTVFVGGLSGYVTEDELRSFFQGFGEITYVKIPPGKGCGFVQFVHRHAAEMAINQMQGYPIGNSRVRLSWGRSQNNSGVGTPYRPAPPPPHYMGMPSHGGPGNYGPQHFGGPAPGPQGPPGPPGPPGPGGPPQEF
ncbi:putative RNA-binding protein [Fusarium oxysporum f. sp. raphani]|uniref:Putative RNA-binding protein n=1 Tax=Fusarium oxysporum f. sp. raphani TaxID=96318 RepID=A0A8J5PPC8_FUSOX|nr:putative RNA-binding protein [Fusarium oxysporum f. sp. raphani]